jgi:hypothetical protein
MQKENDMKKLITLVAVTIAMYCFVGKASCATIPIYNMSGTFNMNFQSKGGSIFDSILGNDNGWTLSVVNPRVYNYRYSDGDILTDLSSSLFSFQFTGEDADLLNSTIAPHFDNMGFRMTTLGSSMDWSLQLGSYSADYYDYFPSFRVEGVGIDLFPVDVDGFPIIGPLPFSVDIDLTTLTETIGDIRYDFAAVNNGIFSNTPIPSAVWLLGSGLIGLVGFRKRFRK